MKYYYLMFIICQGSLAIVESQRGNENKEKSYEKNMWYVKAKNPAEIPKSATVCSNCLSVQRRSNE
jgi:hypothetical protein